jgi:putative methionine-R-sulfoxide reductase with GAF domain
MEVIPEAKPNQTLTFHSINIIQLIAHQEENIEDIISYFAISLFRQNTADEILWDLAKNCISKLDFEDCVIYLVDEQKNVLVQKAAYGPKNIKDFIIHQPIDIPLGEGIVGSVALSGVAEIIHDTSKDPRYIKDDAFRYSEISVPIVLDGKVIGVIDSEHTQPNFFSRRHLKILHLIAALCSNKLIRAKAEEESRRSHEELEAAKRKFSELKIQALRAQLNPHFIFNALNAIQYFITEKKTKLTLRYLSLFAKFIRKILNSYSRNLITLADEINILRNYLTLEELRFGPRLKYQIHINERVSEDGVEIPVLLIQPFVERVVTDALTKQAPEVILKISFKQDDKGIVCDIHTNYACGDSMKPRSIIRVETILSEEWGELGERIYLLNKIYQSNIEVQVRDSSVSISIPHLV